MLLLQRERGGKRYRVKVDIQGLFLIWEICKDCEEVCKKIAAYPFNDTCTNSSHKPFDSFRPRGRKGQGRAWLLRCKQSNTFLKATFQRSQGLLKNFEEPLKLGSLFQISVCVEEQSFIRTRCSSSSLIRSSWDMGGQTAVDIVDQRWRKAETAICLM